MNYDETKKSIILVETEINIVDLAILELGGPFHSSFAKHLQTYHFDQYDKIREELNLNSAINIDNLHFVIDIIQVFLMETLDSDWGTTYVDVSKKEVEDLLAGFIEIYSKQVEKY